MKKHDYYYGGDDNGQYEEHGYDQQMPQQPQPGYGDNSGYYPPQQPIPPQNGNGYGYGYNDQQDLSDDDGDGDDGYNGAQALPPPPQDGQPPPGGQQPPPQQGPPPPGGIPPPPPGAGEEPCSTLMGDDAADDEDAMQLGPDINIIEQAPNVGTTIKFGYAEIFIAFICVVLLCCGAALCWNRKKYGSMKKLVDDDNENKFFNYSTFDNV